MKNLSSIYTVQGLGILTISFIVFSIVFLSIFWKWKKINILNFFIYDSIILMILTSIYFYLSLYSKKNEPFINRLKEISDPFIMMLTFTALLISIFTLIKTSKQSQESKDEEMINILIKNNFDMFINKTYLDPTTTNKDKKEYISFEQRIALFYNQLKNATSETGYKMFLMNEMFKNVIDKNGYSLINLVETDENIDKKEKDRIIKILKSDTKEYSTLIYPFLSLVDETLFKKLELIDPKKSNVIKQSTLKQMNSNFLANFYDAFRDSTFKKQWEEPINFKSMNKVSSEIFASNYSTFGHFYRHLHRIIKYINVHIKDESSKKEYFGILRAQYSDLALIVIFYNCIYVEDGYGLGYQLLYSDFFGTKEDFSKNLSHFPENRFLNLAYEKPLLFKLFLSESNKKMDNRIHSLKSYIETIHNS